MPLKIRPACPLAFKELFFRHPGNPIFTPRNWPYAANAVFNPAATIYQDKVLLLIRVEDRRGFSHLTKAVSEDGIKEWVVDRTPTLMPDPVNFPDEIWGIEDPRITWIEELRKYAVTYTAFSPSGPLVALAFTKDFETFEKMGPIMPPEDKDAALFPRRFNGRFALIHRPVSPFTGYAHIWISFSKDLKYWGEHQILLHARSGGWWDSNKIGLSPQPLETPEGWLIMYHGVRNTAAGAIYRLGLALLDPDDPTLVISRSDEWVFGPTEDYEREGDVAQVVFPCGWVLDKDGETVKMYYGGADTCVALATAKLSDLLEYIKNPPLSSIG